MRKSILFITGSIICCGILYFILAFLAGFFGFIHDGCDEISIWFIVIILYIAFCTNLILNKISSIAKKGEK